MATQQSPRSGVSHPPQIPTQRWENEGGAPSNQQRQTQPAPGRDLIEKQNMPSTPGRTQGEDASQARIRDRAYAIYSDRVRTGESGDCHSDWARAEREMAADQKSARDDASRDTIGNALR